MPDEKTSIGELIAALRQFPTDMRVVVPGPEGGYDDVTVAQRIDIVVGRKKSSAYTGKHSDVIDREMFPDETYGEAVVLRYGG